MTVAVLMAPPRRAKQVIHGGGKGRALPSSHPLTEWLHRVGYRAQDYRRSYANVWRRLERGETPVVCGTCGTEVDVAVPVHDNRCDESEAL